MYDVCEVCGAGEMVWDATNDCYVCDNCHHQEDDIGYDDGEDETVFEWPGRAFENGRPIE